MDTVGSAEGQIAHSVARSVGDLTACWEVAYRAYMTRNLIRSNRFGWHTAIEAVDGESVFILGRHRGVGVSTAAGIVDGPTGLPLDAVYGEELGALRNAGRRLFEIGLVANLVGGGLLETLRMVAFFGMHAGCTDFVCGMHPRRADLYRRLFCMRPAGPVRGYGAMNNQPVLLMRGVYADLPACTARRRLDEPKLPRSVFAGRAQAKAAAETDPAVSAFVAFMRKGGRGGQGG